MNWVMRELDHDEYQDVILFMKYKGLIKENPKLQFLKN